MFNWIKYISIVEAVYIIFTYNFYKTRYSIHHPFEYFFTGNLGIFKHPVYSGKYENKVCVFGSFISFIGAGLLLYRGFNPANELTKPAFYIANTWLVGALLMNLNAFIYFIPVYLTELYIYMHQ